jgi:hypothetical protein
MSHHPLRTLLPVTVLALTALAAGCTTAPTRAAAPVAPTTTVTSPPSPEAATPAPATYPTRSTAPTPRPQTTRPATKAPPGCLGAVTYTIHAGKPRPATNKVCITVGGVLRVEYLEPDGMRIEPAGNVSCAFKAGDHDCRLIAPGTHTVLINSFYWTYSFTLVVAPATVPPRPAPACITKSPHTVDASVKAPPWPALCLSTRVVLRIANNGPGGFTVSPAENASCFYEAGVRECRFLKAGTVTFSVTNPNEVRRLIVVAVR